MQGLLPPRSSLFPRVAAGSGEEARGSVSKLAASEGRLQPPPACWGCRGCRSPGTRAGTEDRPPAMHCPCRWCSSQAGPSLSGFRLPSYQRCDVAVRHKSPCRACSVARLQETWPVALGGGCISVGHNASGALGEKRGCQSPGSGLFCSPFWRPLAPSRGSPVHSPWTSSPMGLSFCSESQTPGPTQLSEFAGGRGDWCS